MKVKRLMQIVLVTFCYVNLAGITLHPIKARADNNVANRNMTHVV